MLEAAEHAFAARGFHAASVDRIAEASGITKPMVYAYFGSKEGLYRACMERARARLLDALRDGVDTSAAPDQQLWHGLLAVFTFVEREQAVPELLVGCGAGVDAVAQRAEQAHAGTFHARPVQALLGAEVGVDHRLGDAGGLGDRVDGGGVEAAVGERALGRLEHLPLPDLSGDFPGTSCVRSHGSGWGHRGGEDDLADRGAAGRVGLALGHGARRHDERGAEHRAD